MSRMFPSHEPITPPMRDTVERAPQAPRRPPNNDRQPLRVVTNLNWQTQTDNVFVAVGNPTMGFVERPVVLQGSGRPLALLPHRHDSMEILLPGPPSPSPSPRPPAWRSYRQVVVTPTQSPTAATSRLKKLEFLPWEQLPEHVVDSEFWNNEECCIDHEALSDLQQPVALVDQHTAHVFEYATLQQWFRLAPQCCDGSRQRMQNPYNRKWVDVSALQRIVLNKNPEGGNQL